VNNSDGSDNNAIGAFALNANVSGNFNNAHGRHALFNCTSDQNNAFGDLALESVTTGFGNSGFGDNALSNVTTGSFNTALGINAGLNQATGNNNIYIGDLVVSGESNVIAIGAIASSGTSYTDCFIGAIRNSVETDQPVLIGVNGHLGTAVSSQRYKDDVRPMGDKSQALFSLKPVTFRYKKEIDPSQRLSFGLIAEQAAAISPDLVSRDRNGQPRSVRYEAVNAMLLNEFLKGHKKAQEQEAVIAQLKGELQTVAGQLKEQAAQIREVRARLGNAAPETVAER